MRTIFLAAALVASTPAAAEVVSSDENGFSIRVEASTAAAPEAVFALFATPQRWWSPTHTWSGDSASMRIEPQRAGGCWCEALPLLGSVEHGHIIRWDPEHSRVLFRAELGPLQALPVNGKLEWIAVGLPDGTTRVAMRYEVAGRGMDDPVALASAVDGVLGQQLARLIAAADAAASPGTPPPPAAAQAGSAPAAAAASPSR